MVETDETEDENDGWPKVTENQTNQVVATDLVLYPEEGSIAETSVRLDFPNNSVSITIFQF